MFRKSLLAAAVALTCQTLCFAGNAAEPVGEPVLEVPTLKCLGAYWVIKGDDNKNAVIDVAYRKVGTQDWKAGPPLFRVAKKANKDKTIQLDENSWLFAGSVIDIPEATDYELKLTLNDPDGGKEEKILKAHTIAEPVAPKGPEYHVVPGSGGGTGTKDDPFKGIPAAEKAAKPGDTFLLHAGTYEGQWQVKKSGEQDKPIVWKGAGDGEAILHYEVEGKDDGGGHQVDATSRHDVWFENLTLKAHCYSNICVHDATRIVIRRCHLVSSNSGIYGTKNSGKLGQLFISDNLLEGNDFFPATQEQWEAEKRGVWIAGAGNVVCYNRIHHYKDGIDTDIKQGYPVVANDFFNNEVSDSADDGSEMDGSWRNCRNFNNRYVDTLTGVSIQPVFGGPIYITHNVLYNVRTEFFKLHNNPSGVLFIHNTCVHYGPVWFASGKSVPENCFSRNNLMIGTEGKALDIDMNSKDLDFDYDGFGGWSGQYFLKYINNGKKIVYSTPEETRKKSEIEKHLVIVDPASTFASGLKPPEVGPDYDAKRPGHAWTTGLKTYKPETVDVRLKEGSPAIDAGQPLPGFNDNFAGKAPDLGACEVGAPLPHYGPRQQNP